MCRSRLTLPWGQKFREGQQLEQAGRSMGQEPHVADASWADFVTFGDVRLLPIAPVNLHEAGDELTFRRIRHAALR
jgi:hypothetical protein